MMRARVSAARDRVDVAALGGKRRDCETVAKIQRFFLTELFRSDSGTLSSSAVVTMLRALRDP